MSCYEIVVSICVMVRFSLAVVCYRLVGGVWGDSTGVDTHMVLVLLNQSVPIRVYQL